MITYNKQSNYYYSDMMSSASFFSGFSTRGLGDGRDPESIFSFLRINQVLFRKLVVLEQIHSVNIKRFSSENSAVLEKIPDADGIISREKGIVFAVRTADCLPVLYADREQGIVGVSHNGWRGTMNQMTIKMIDAMVQMGAQRERITIAFGPSIGPCCYDVDDERYYSFREQLGYESRAFRFRGGVWHLNLMQLNYEQARNAGIMKESIDFFPFCTACNRHAFFSYRRDHKKHPEQFGEMFSFIIQS